MKADGSALCWGRNDYGQSTPPTGLQAAQLTGGGDHTCALTTNDDVVCWGYNGDGEANVPGGLNPLHLRPAAQEERP